MDLQARADHLAQMIEEKLGVGGKGLEAKLARAGRRLPRHVRREAALLAEALGQRDHPRLSRRIDLLRLERAFTVCERYLKTVDPWARRRGLALDWLAVNALNLLIIGVLVVSALLWRGFL